MKKYLLFHFFVFIVIKVNGQYVVIPDTNFLNKIISVAPSAVSGNMIDTTDGNLISIQSLVLNGSNISDLSGIEYFDGLTQLSSESNNLNSIPIRFPPLLWNLNLSRNPISVINRLPESLTTFACVQCSTTIIDSFPDYLDEILIGVNQLTKLPTLPSNLQIIDCSDNLLDSLPQLPNPLAVLVCSRNPIYCLPILPNSFNQLYAAGTYITCIPNHPPIFNLSDIGFTICDSTNTTCPLLLTSISEMKSSLILEIFPNPSSNTFIVKYNSSYENWLLQVMNPLGEIVYSERMFNNRESKVDVKIPKGIYFVKVNAVMKKLVIE